MGTGTTLPTSPGPSRGSSGLIDHTSQGGRVLLAKHRLWVLGGDANFWSLLYRWRPVLHMDTTFLYRAVPLFVSPTPRPTRNALDLRSVSPNYVPEGVSSRERIRKDFSRPGPDGHYGYTIGFGDRSESDGRFSWATLGM
jgi:hypothetical protein